MAEPLREKKERDSIKIRERVQKRPLFKGKRHCFVGATMSIFFDQMQTFWYMYLVNGITVKLMEIKHYNR